MLTQGGALTSSTDLTGAMGTNILKWSIWK